MCSSRAAQVSRPRKIDHCAASGERAQAIEAFEFKDLPYLSSVLISSRPQMDAALSSATLAKVPPRPRPRSMINRHRLATNGNLCVSVCLLVQLARVRPTNESESRSRTE